MSDGWIALHRKFAEHPLWSKRRIFSEAEAWIDILMEVNHTERKVLIGGRVITCKRGQSLNSNGTWASRWNWTESKVRRYWNLLKSMDMIETENLRKTTRLTVCNYDTYQTPRRDSDETPTTNNNETMKGVKTKGGRFTPPTVSEVQTYAASVDFPELDAESFCSHYEANGWMRGKSKIKSWKACVRTWKSRKKPGGSKTRDQQEREFFGTKGKGG